MDIYTAVHPSNGTLFSAQKKELSNHEKTWKNLNYVLVM